MFITNFQRVYIHLANKSIYHHDFIKVYRLFKCLNKTQMNTYPSNEHHQKNRFAIKFGYFELFVRQIYNSVYIFKLPYFSLKLVNKSGKPLSF